MFFVYAKTTTKQTYQIYVGSGFTVGTKDPNDQSSDLHAVQSGSHLSAREQIYQRRLADRPGRWITITQRPVPTASRTAASSRSRST